MIPLSRTLGAAAAAALGLSGLATVAATATAAPASAATVTLASTIALDNCSASLVRWPSSAGTDRAMMLTNGHCYEGGFIDNGVVLTDRASSRSGTVLSSSGSALGTVRADRLIYGTMTGTDVALYRLTQTYDQVAAATGTTALTVSPTHPVDGTAITIPSSYWKTTYDCTINGFVDTLREGQWEWHDSIRYDMGCNTIHGTSGSPIVDNASGQVVGINNTGNDDGLRCTDNNPCEVNPDGSVVVRKGQSYGQQTYWFTTCLNSSRQVDLTVSGCLLPGASAGDPTPPPPTGDNLLTNPGFESGQTGWTGTTGPITNDPGRPARTGSWKLWLGGNGSTATESERQSVTIPATASSAQLSFWLRSDTAETGSTVYDRMRVQVIAGGVTRTLKTYTNVGVNSTYTQQSLDLSAYAGQQVTVKFLATEDSAAQTSWVVDDTAVTAS